MKVLHASYLTYSVKGIENQLEFERRAAEKSQISWTSRLFLANYEDSELNGRNIVSSRIKVPGTGFVIRGLNFFIFRYEFYKWIVSSAKDYDLILLRYNFHDPFLYFLVKKLDKPVFTVHHTIERIELIATGRWGFLRAALDDFIFYFMSRYLGGILSVTKEINNYQLSRAHLSLSKENCFIYPNGLFLNYEPISTSSLKTRSSTPNIIFLASYFTPWQGLDKLIDAVSRSEECFTIHIVGEVSEELSVNLNLDKRFEQHGSLPHDAIKEIADGCLLGLGPLGSERLGMEESSALKVREYLSMGLPVYSGDQDVFPEDFPFYCRGKVEMSSILDFLNKVDKFCPDEVVSISAEYIDKTRILTRVYSLLTGEKTLQLK